jgi:hypothetical protein
VVRDNGETVGGPAPPDGGGVDADPAVFVAAVASTVLADLSQARDPFEGELALCGVFGALEAGAPEDAAERRTRRIALLIRLVEHCLLSRTSSSLAFLRLAARLGPGPARVAADEAAAQLAAAGVMDLPWPRGAGSPVFVRSWRYGNMRETRSMIGLLFAYEDHEHALVLWIDHGLGGGIRDVWVAVGREARGMRADVAGFMGLDPTSYFEDLTPRQALEVLRSALAAPPCPEEPDQVEDVAARLYLTHSRAQLIADTLGEEPVALFADQ